MGLDDFKSEDSPNTSKNNTNSNSGNSSKSDGKKDSKKNEPFKVVGFGRNTKTFQTEEDWDITVDYIEEEMGFEIGTVLNWPNQYRHKALHVAILNGKLGENAEFDVEKECEVCGRTFQFPKEWDYMEYRDTITCPTHEFREVVKAHKSK